jgi:hypothetical protein
LRIQYEDSAKMTLSDPRLIFLNLEDVTRSSNCIILLD